MKTREQIKAQIGRQLRYQARKAAKVGFAAARMDLERAEVVEKFTVKMKEIKASA